MKKLDNESIIPTVEFLKKNSRKIDWEDLSHRKLPFDVIYEFRKKLNFDVISKTTFSLEQLRKISRMINWEIYSQNNILTEEHYNVFTATDFWESVSKYQKFTTPLLRKYMKHLRMHINLVIANKENENILTTQMMKDKNLSYLIDWGKIINFYEISPEVIQEIFEKNTETFFPWDISQYMSIIFSNEKYRNSFPQEFLDFIISKLRNGEEKDCVVNAIEKYQNGKTIKKEINIKDLYEKITIDEIVDKKNDFDWNILSQRHFSIDELKQIRRKIIWEEFGKHNTYTKDHYKFFKTNSKFWKSASTTQVLTEEFILKNINRFNIDDLVVHQKLSKDFILKNLKNLKYRDVLKYQEIDSELLTKIVENLINEEYHYLFSFVVIHQKVPENLIVKMTEEILKISNNVEKNNFFKNVCKYQKTSPEYFIIYQKNIDFDLYFEYNSNLMFLKPEYLQNMDFYKYIISDYEKCVFLKNKIIDFLYRPITGPMYKKTEIHFESLRY